MRRLIKQLTYQPFIIEMNLFILDFENLLPFTVHLIPAGAQT